MTKPTIPNAMQELSAEAVKSPGVRLQALRAIQAFARGEIDKPQLSQETKPMKENLKAMRAKIKSAKAAAVDSA